MGLSVVWLVSDGHQKAFRIIFSILSLFYSFIFVWLDSTSILSLCAFILTFLPLSRLFLSSSWTGASSWTFPPSTSVWLTRRASMTWRRSPPEPSDRSLLNYQLSHPFLFPFFFFVPLTLALSVSIKSDTQLRYKLLVPVVLSHCSLVYSSAHRKRTASWLCTMDSRDVNYHHTSIPSTMRPTSWRCRKILKFHLLAFWPQLMVFISGCSLFSCHRNGSVFTFWWER